MARYRYPNYIFTPPVVKLRDMIQKDGRIKIAEKFHIDPSYLQNIADGSHPPPVWLCNLLGFTVQIAYVEEGQPFDITKLYPIERYPRMLKKRKSEFKTRSNKP
jgi:hypothetical protein